MVARARYNSQDGWFLDENEESAAPESSLAWVGHNPDGKLHTITEIEFNREEMANIIGNRVNRVNRVNCISTKSSDITLKPPPLISSARKTNGSKWFQASLNAIEENPLHHVSCSEDLKCKFKSTTKKISKTKTKRKRFWTREQKQHFRRKQLDMNTFLNLESHFIRYDFGTKLLLMIGGTSKCLKMEGSGQRIDEWIVYVYNRNDLDGKHLKDYVQKMQFSCPFEMVEIDRPPFQVMRCGHYDREFTIRIRLFFHPELNQKPIELIQQIVLNNSITSSMEPPQVMEKLIEVRLSQTLKESTVIVRETENRSKKKKIRKTIEKQQDAKDNKSLMEFLSTITIDNDDHHVPDFNDIERVQPSIILTETNIEESLPKTNIEESRPKKSNGYKNTNVGPMTSSNPLPNRNKSSIKHEYDMKGFYLKDRTNQQNYSQHSLIPPPPLRGLKTVVIPSSSQSQPTIVKPTTCNISPVHGSWTPVISCSKPVVNLIKTNTIVQRRMVTFIDAGGNKNLIPMWVSLSPKGISSGQLPLI